ncbi:hypothetical protein [Paenibacillus periandrae]|uniref:hypothetical protein n=1 Tax=Paenibacillus periandrae TaxID=1761741 RepID=UPI001F093132|nr:hypothetical protein [Paenibacillus periandrae]
MEVVIRIIFVAGLLLNLILMTRERKDERWNRILNKPLSYAFNLLFLGYTLIALVSNYWTFDLITYKSIYDYLFSGVLIIYVIFIVLERRRLS